jgi:tripartite-type tricarboxylate transporter receptor subunit TctC
MNHVATFAEQGVPGFEAATWFMLIGPAAMPAEVAARIRTDTATLLREPDTLERMRGFGAEAPATPIADLAGFLRGEVARWGRVVRTAGIKAD